MIRAFTNFTRSEGETFFTVKVASPCDLGVVVHSRDHSGTIGDAVARVWFYAGSPCLVIAPAIALQSHFHHAPAASFGSFFDGWLPDYPRREVLAP